MAEFAFLHAPADRIAVEAICAALSKRGLSCTLEGEAGAKATLVAWSAAASIDPMVLDRAGAARDTGALVPITLDGSLPPIGFRQVQTANLANGPTGASFHALAQALIRLRDGAPAADAPKSAPQGPFLTTPRFWLLSLLTAAAIGALQFVAPESQAGLSVDAAGRLADLAAAVAVVFVLAPLARLLLHGARRFAGKASVAFFSRDYLIVLAIAAVAAGALAYRNAMSGGPSVLATLAAGLAVFPALIALVIFLFSAVRRVFTPRRA